MTAYALLGLLSFDRELSGYDLKKWADSSLRFFYWSPATSQIYVELKRLEKLGFVTAARRPRTSCATSGSTGSPTRDATSSQAG